MADKNFSANSSVTYDVDANGTTTVTHEISLINKTSDFYATSYTLSLNGISPIEPTAFEGSQNLPVKVDVKNNITSLEVNFTNAVVGKNEKREFGIVFKDKTLVNKAGEIWEILTPKLGDNESFEFYSTILKIPNSFGNLAYVSPQASYEKTEKGKKIYGFDKSASLNTTVTAAFGPFQVFSFDLTYHLENPLNYEAVTEIALPPDTSYQRMNYKNIQPKPAKITIDGDGNWIASYKLKPKEKIDVKAEGAVQIFPDSLNDPKANIHNINSYLKPTEYWQVNDVKIQELAKKYKTPREIYDYVRKTLVYDYARVAPNMQRLGASKALENPNNAICTEFTDLFIAISRAAGIPAREIEGYAYTENPKIQPLSLVADVLHAWPEYWNKEIQAWVPVDPTWGSTSGIDYFEKLDLRHFAFVIHGADDKKPYPAGSYKLGTNPQKDVNVTYGQLTTKRTPEIKVTNRVLSQLPFSDEIVGTKIENYGPTAIYNYSLKPLYDPNLANGYEGKAENIDVIPPFGFYETNIKVPYSFLGRTTPAKVELLVNGTKQSEFVTYKNYLTISNLLLVCVLMFFLIFLIYLVFKNGRKFKKQS